MTNDEMIKARILKVLEIYPKISPSMLQIGIGSSLPAKMWHPVLETLIEEGVIVRDNIVALSSTDRQQVYKVLSLAPPVETLTEAQ
jgi:S1-C subfamily serine protease